MKNVVFVALFILNFFFGVAQDCFCGKSNISDIGITDGVAVLENVATKKLIPYEYVREADVLWSKKVWSYIDLREKINLPLHYPLDEITNNGFWLQSNRNVSLWSVIRCNVLAGNLTLFSPYNPNNLFGKQDGDQLKYPVKPVAGKNFYSDKDFRESALYFFAKLGPQSDIALTNEFGEPLEEEINGVRSIVYSPRDTIWYTSADIIQYRIKEEWFFDKERSKMDTRILAIAPVVMDYELNASGEKVILGTKELFWLHFPECRSIFNNYLLENSKNDSQMMSFDDLFWKHQFNSIVYKESNVYDRKIEDYTNGVDALFESHKIKEEIRTLESDVWSY